MAERTGMIEAYEWRGREVIGSDGDKVGRLEEIYVDQRSGQPEWALVNTGLLGSRSSFVPLRGTVPSGENVRLAYSKDQIKDAPSVEADGELSFEEERELYRHYGLAYGEAEAGADRSDRGAGAGTVGRDTSGPATDDAMTRSEEELRVGTTARERGRARLRKYVVTEEVQTTVPVRREEVRLEREPIADSNLGAATDGPAISEEEHEVTLHEEEVVVDKRAVPKERVRLGKETVVDERQVSEEVRKERIEAEDDAQR